ncbi:MAG: hypothetical protein C0600_07910 [Ignavibacteria bacterium]|nr:MAG: hypothetical protein C0600_07910 [Ignavibacteria bacterium]
MSIRMFVALFALFIVSAPSVQAQVPCEAHRLFNTTGQELVYISPMPTPWWGIKYFVEWDAEVDTAYVALGVNRHQNSGITPDTLEMRILADKLPSIQVLDHKTVVVPPNLQGLVPDGYYIMEFEFSPPVAFVPGQSRFWLSWRLRGPAGDQARIRLKYPAANARRSVVIGAAGDTTIATVFVKQALGLGRQDSVDLWGEVHVCYPNGIPVELSAFSAAYRDGQAHLRWETATETNNYGFDIERLAATSEEDGLRVWQRIGFIEGHGSTTEPHLYTFVDKSPADAIQAGGNVVYRLRQIDTDGTTELSHVAQIQIPIKTGFVLEQSYPNPASLTDGRTTLILQLAEEVPVRLDLYDALGRHVRTVQDGLMDSGRHFLDVSLAGLHTGSYFFRLTAGDQHLTRRMLVTE